MSPPIEVFLTTIVTSPALRQRQEYILRALQIRKIPFTSYDLATDEDAKRLWRRKAPSTKQQLPGLLVGGSHIGGYEEFEDAVECEDLDTFLRRNEEWDEELSGHSKKLEAKPVGVPGAYSPLQMNPSHKSTASPHPTPTKPKDGSRGREVNLGEELSGYGLDGVAVDEQDLMDLVSELIGEEGAGDLVRGFKVPASEKKEKAKEKAEKEKIQEKVEKEKVQEKVEKEKVQEKVEKEKVQEKAEKEEVREEAENVEVKGEVEEKGEVKEEAEKKEHDDVEELARELEDAKINEEKEESEPLNAKPTPDTKPTEGPPEVKQEDNLVTEATPSDADKGSA